MMTSCSPSSAALYIQRIPDTDAEDCSGWINVNLSDKESADVRIEKSDGNQHSKNEMAFPQLL